MESSSGPDVIDNFTVKVSCRKDKIERNFLLPEMDIHDISTLKDLKFYLTHKLPIREIQYATPRLYGLHMSDFSTSLSVQQPLLSPFAVTQRLTTKLEAK